MKKTLLLTSILALACQFNLAGTEGTYRSTTTSKRSYDSTTYSDAKDLKKPMIEQDLPYLFKANEWSVDVFGTRAFTEKSGLYRDDFGGGLGVNYFFSRYFGVGFDGYAWDGSKNDTVGAVSGNLIVRFPIEHCHLAPYLFAGPGGHFGPQTELSAQGGGGVEYRFSDKMGVFADARYVAVDNQNNYVLPRVGLRFNF
ncbi:MAG: outer membrane beta-barrel protein [Verrucomicrobiota bacterium]